MTYLLYAYLALLVFFLGLSRESLFLPSTSKKEAVVMLLVVLFWPLSILFAVYENYMSNRAWKKFMEERGHSK